MAARASRCSARIHADCAVGAAARVRFDLTLALGALCGLIAVAFHLTISLAEDLLINRAFAANGYTWIFWTIFMPTLGGLISGALLQYVVPDARSSGIPQVKVAYAIKGGVYLFFIRRLENSSFRHYK